MHPPPSPPCWVSLRPASFPNRSHFLLIALSFSVSLPCRCCLNHGRVRWAKAEEGERAREWAEGAKGRDEEEGRKGRGNRSRTVTAVYYLLLVTTCGVEVKDEMEGVWACVRACVWVGGEGKRNQAGRR